MSEYGSAQNALAQLPQIAQDAGVDNYQSFSEAAALAEMKAGAKFGARLIFKGEASYPKPLYDLGDAPPMLWVKGNIDLIACKSVAMVGARNASSLGTRMAKYLAQDMGAHDWIIVSGLARGIDAAAHTAALTTGTIAVLGGGVDVFYPTENRQLAEAIAEKGLLISEQPMGL
jgi:DNA processing protein